MKISKRAESMAPSATLTITAAAKELAAAGKDVVSFTAGEPDFRPPAGVMEAASKALAENRSRYTPTAGIPELREAISRKLSSENGLAYKSDSIVVTVGAKQAIFNALMALVDPGDEVVILPPYWVSYPEQVKAAGGKPVFAGSGKSFKPDLAVMAGAFTQKTRVLILNSPCNPTGTVTGPETLKEMAAILRKFPDVSIISDEIYEKLVFDGTKHVNILNVAPDLADRTVIANGFSKSFAVPGWRLGWAAGPAPLIKAMTKIQDHSTSNASSIAQYALLAALNSPQDWFAGVLDEYSKRRKAIVDGLNGIPGFSVAPPMGAFYAFADVSPLLPAKLGRKELRGSEDFAKALLDDALVAVIPGLPFGAENCLRFSCTIPVDAIRKGVERTAEFAKKLA